ncbi:MAG: hypothetical protein V7719_13045 [Psychroserpens sp.]|uniref:hypothetical protein n=1 Tax=Psychroserpens sp. TaxID=2020870 RepID=UPI0030018634
MKHLLILIISIAASNLCYCQKQEPTVEAEFDTIFNFQFESLKNKHNKKILIDESHNTIYSLPYGKKTAREMLRIMSEDGFDVQFTDKVLDSINLNNHKPDILILHGMPNDKIILNSGEKNEILYKSPLVQNEVVGIGKYVYNGGSLLIFLSHHPGGSGALPLLEAFNVKFRDGYANHPKSPGYNCSVCSQFIMTTENGMINTNHPIFTSRLSDELLPKTVKFLCGAAVFRNPEDSVLPLPNNTTNYTRSSEGLNIEESSDSYSGMIGFEYGKGRVIVATDQGMFRSLDLLLDGEKIPVTIHDPDCDNAELFLNCIRWLGKLQ